MSRRPSSRPRRTLLGICALGTGLIAAGCSLGGGPEEPELTVSGAFMPQPVSDMAAGFLTVRNGGGGADKLTAVTSALSDDVSIHESKGQKMRKAESFDVPADGELALERGGRHIMFMGLKKKPKQGESIPVELHFEKSDSIKVELPVKPANHDPAPRGRTEGTDPAHDGADAGAHDPAEH